MVQGFSANADMSDGTANNFVTKPISLILKSHVKTLINRQIIQMLIFININLDKAFFCKKKYLILSNMFA